MRCYYSKKNILCPYVGIGSGCMGAGCPELDYEEPEMETYYDEDGYLQERIKED